MTLFTGTVRSVAYTASAAQTDFAVPFWFGDAGDLTATVDGTLRTFSLVSFIQDGGLYTSGVIRLSSPCTASQAVVVSRMMQKRQRVLFPLSGRFNALRLNEELARLWMSDQDGAGATAGALRIPEGGTPTYPNAATRAGKLASFDGAGNPAVTSGSVGTILTTSYSATLLGASTAPAARTILGLTGVSGAGGVETAQPGAGAVTRTVEAKLRDVFNVRDFGAVGDGVTNDAPAIQACVNAAAGRTIFAPVGQYLLNSAITSSLPINLVGDGNGAGPGSAEQSNSNCTQFLLNFANPTAFSVVNNKPSTFRNFQINVSPAFRTPGRTGFGIVLYAEAAASATQANSVFENVAFNWVAIGIGIFRPNWPTIEDCYFGDWASDAIYMQTVAPAEGSGGQISNNYFFGGLDGVQSSCIKIRCGYVVISNNEMIGAQIGVHVEVSDFNAGYIRIIDNTIEEQYYGGIRVAALGSIDASLLDITGNEFSALYSTATYQYGIFLQDSARIWLKSATICRNHFYFYHSLSVGFIRAGAGQNMQITGNILTCTVTAALGIGVVGVSVNTSLGQPILVADNTFLGTFTAKYLLNPSALVVVRDHNGGTFAQLPANPANGSQIYCTDGRSTAAGNYTVRDGGTGALAMRQRGAWLTPGDLA